MTKVLIEASIESYILTIHFLQPCSVFVLSICHPQISSVPHTVSDCGHNCQDMTHDITTILIEFSNQRWDHRMILIIIVSNEFYLNWREIQWIQRIHRIWKIIEAGIGVNLNILSVTSWCCGIISVSNTRGFCIWNSDFLQKYFTSSIDSTEITPISLACVHTKYFP